MLGVTGLVIAAVIMLGMVHGGGLDGYGGHHDRKLGGYHFHRGPLAGKSYDSQSQAIAALESLRKKQPSTSNPIQGSSPQQATLQQQVDAFKLALIKKKIITQAEYDQALAEMLKKKDD